MNFLLLSLKLSNVFFVFVLATPNFNVRVTHVAFIVGRDPTTKLSVLKKIFLLSVLTVKVLINLMILLVQNFTFRNEFASWLLLKTSLFQTLSSSLRNLARITQIT